MNDDDMVGNRRFACESGWTGCNRYSLHADSPVSAVVSHYHEADTATVVAAAGSPRSYVTDIIDLIYQPKFAG